MKYVQRDAQNNIIGIFSNPQPGYAEEAVEESSAEVLAMVKAEIWREIKVERDRRAGGGFKVGDKWFHSDVASRLKHLGLLLLGSNIPPGTEWKTMDGTFVQMTQTLAGLIFQSAVVTDISMFAKAEEHRAAMEASQDPAQYDYLSGWPKIYGEPQ